MNANTRQVAGTHYASSTGLQHWDYAVRALDNRYLEGNITKYVVRHRKKNGLQDLDKALHYIQKLQEEFDAGRIEGMHTLTPAQLAFDVHKFCSDNGLNTLEAYVVKRLAHWQRGDHLESVRRSISELRTQYSQHLRHLDASKAGAAEPGSSYTNQG